MGVPEHGRAKNITRLLATAFSLVGAREEAVSDWASVPTSRTEGAECRGAKALGEGVRLRSGTLQGILVFVVIY